MTFENYKNAILAGTGLEDYDKVMFVASEDRNLSTQEFIELIMLVRYLLYDAEK